MLRAVPLRRRPHTRLAEAALAAIPLLAVLVVFWTPVVVWLLRYGALERIVSPFDPMISKSFWTTVWIAAITAIASLLAAYPLAVAWYMLPARLANSLVALACVPLIVGLMARNYSWIGILSAKTAFGSMGLSLIGADSVLFTFEAVLGVMTYIFIPIAFLVLVHSLFGVNRHEILAARTLGATDWEIVRAVLVPHTYRQATVGLFLIFANAIGYYVTPRMLGGGNYDMVGNIVLRFIECGEFGAASSISLSFVTWFTPLYVLVFVLIIGNRRHMIGR
jgi:spermidine/putrescine transport system permease protein